MQERKTIAPTQDVADSASTSDETLAEIEKEEQVTDSNPKESEDSRLPSPDGTDEETRKPDDAGPM